MAAPAKEAQEGGCMMMHYDPLRADERAAQNELLAQHGYSWHLEKEVIRGRTHKRWLLIAPNGQIVSVFQALARIEASQQKRGA